MISPIKGQRIIRCFSPANPHYFEDAQKILWPIDLPRIDESQSLNSDIGDIWLRQKNVVSCGIRKDSSLLKYLGLRHDFEQAGEAQLEFSDPIIEIDGKAQDVDLSKNIFIDPVTTDLGSLIIRSTRKSTRQFVKMTKPINDFHLMFRVHATGLTMQYRSDLDEYWFFSKADGKFRFRFPKPTVMNLNWEQVLDYDGDPIDELVSHSLVQDGEDWIYAKVPGPNWGNADLPEQFLIDKATITSEAGDVWALRDNQATWAGARDNATSRVFNDTDSHKTNVMQALDDGQFDVRRCFFGFDVSGEVGTAINPSTLSFQGDIDVGDVISITPSTHDDPYVNANFNDITHTAYDTIGSWVAFARNVFTLDAQGLIDLNAAVGSGIFKVSLRENDHDIADVAPSSAAFQGGVYFSEDVSGTKDPFAEITVAAGGGFFSNYYYMQGQGVV